MAGLLISFIIQSYSTLHYPSQPSWISFPLPLIDNVLFILCLSNLANSDIITSVWAFYPTVIAPRLHKFWYCPQLCPRQTRQIVCPKHILTNISSYQLRTRLNHAYSAIRWVHCSPVLATSCFYLQAHRADPTTSTYYVYWEFIAHRIVQVLVFCPHWDTISIDRAVFPERECTWDVVWPV